MTEPTKEALAKAQRWLDTAEHPMCDQARSLALLLYSVRAEALEEAAKACLKRGAGSSFSAYRHCHDAVRALKTSGPSVARPSPISAAEHAKRAPLPPEVLACAEQDPVHAETGRLIASKPIETSAASVVEDDSCANCGRRGTLVWHAGGWYCPGCEDLEGLLADTFNMVSERAGSKITVQR